MGERQSFQRLKILEILERGGHWSAEDLYQQLKAEIPTLSLATVYRNLHRLEKEGKAREVAVDGWPFKLWEAARSPHFHFVCRKCRKVWDLDLRLDTVEELVPHVPGEVENLRGFLYGVCHACKQEEHAK